MRVLTMTEELVASCDQLRAFVRQPENWYHVGMVDWVPGNRPEFVLELSGGFRVVLSVTVVPQAPRPLLHMSMSVPGDRYPHPLAVWNMAHVLGFTGATMQDDLVIGPGAWAIAVNEEDHCIVVQQPLEDA